MSVAAYSRFTEAGIARRAAERRAAVLPTPNAPEPEIARVEALKAVSAPVVIRAVERVYAFNDNVIALHVPRDELKHIIDLVARMHGCTYAQVMSRARRHRISNARMAAICAIRQARPVMSLPQIGRLFDRDHSTLISAMGKRGFTR